MGGCSSTVRYSSVSSFGNSISFSIPENYPLNEKQEKIISTAHAFLGTPYCYGGKGNDCFDCSGFVDAVYRSVGIELPRVSQDIYQLGSSVPLSQAQPGDLIFFKKGNRINHVGIYSGNGKMIHASTSKGVMLQSFDNDYYQKRYAGIKRIIK
jgi:cell wall-associated NlpC family hydrolase